jgi:hypothetical protein
MTKGAKEAKRPQAAFIIDEAQRLLERRRREVAAHRPRLDSESTICQYEPRREAARSALFLATPAALTPHRICCL